MDETTRRDEEKLEEEEVQEETNDVDDELARVQETATQLENQLKRSLADYQNLQKRVQEEKSSWIRMANKELLLKMLPVLDTLMLAQEHLKDQGLTITIQHFLKVLNEEGVTLMETLGMKFDPVLMEAIGTEKVEGKSERVVKQVRAGYKYYDTILRPAQVIIGE